MRIASLFFTTLLFCGSGTSRVYSAVFTALLGNKHFTTCYLHSETSFWFCIRRQLLRLWHLASASFATAEESMTRARGRVFCSLCDSLPQKRFVSMENTVLYFLHEIKGNHDQLLLHFGIMLALRMCAALEALGRKRSTPSPCCLRVRIAIIVCMSSGCRPADRKQRDKKVSQREHGVPSGYCIAHHRRQLPQSRGPPLSARPHPPKKDRSCSRDLLFLWVLRSLNYLTLFWQFRCFATLRRFRLTLRFERRTIARQVFDVR